MESAYGHPVNLKQYRWIDGKWQFVAVVKQNLKQDPKLVLVRGCGVQGQAELRAIPG
jgi:hypothetical protein